MAPSDREFRREFFNNLDYDRHLEWGDARYIDLYGDRSVMVEDPIAELCDQIGFSDQPATARLLAGYRGSGKSTELRRLAHLLQGSGFATVVVDVQDYLDTTQPVDPATFLLVLAAAFHDAVVTNPPAGAPTVDPGEVGESLGSRLRGLLGRTKVDFSGVEIEAKVGSEALSATFRANLRADASLRRRINDALAGRLGELSGLVNAHVQKIAAQMPGTGAGTVFIVDNVERFRDTDAGGADVERSVEEIFVEHARFLRLPLLHVVYTISPWVRIRGSARLAESFDGSVQLLRAVRVEPRASASQVDPPEPVLDERGFEAMDRLIARRGDWRRLFGDDDEGVNRFRRIVWASGGHLRTLMRLVQLVVVKTVAPPAKEDDVDLAIAQVRDELRVYALDDARFLDGVLRTGLAAVETQAEIATRTARLADTNRLLAYRNHDEWHAVHPLVRAEVRRLIDEFDGEHPVT